MDADNRAVKARGEGTGLCRCGQKGKWEMGNICNRVNNNICYSDGKDMNWKGIGDTHTHTHTADSPFKLPRIFNPCTGLKLSYHRRHNMTY